MKAGKGWRERKRVRRPTYLVDYVDGAGRRRRPTVYSVADAKRMAAEKLLEARQGRMTSEDPHLTLSEYAERWRGQRQVADSTRRIESWALDRHLLPALGAMKLTEIRRRHVRALLESLARDRGLGKVSRRLVRATLSVLFEHAIEDEIVHANPASGVGRRRSTSEMVTPAERIGRVRPLDPAELERLLVTTRAIEPRDAILYLVMAEAGLRPGEALALQKADLEAARRQLRVARSVWQGRVKDTKTHNVRWVDLTPRLTEALTGLAGLPGPPWLFPSEAGTPMDQSRVVKRFRLAARVAAVWPRRLYDLRHTFATHHLLCGANPLYVARQLGHAKATTTLLWYAHWIPTGDSQQAEDLQLWRADIVRRRVADGTVLAPFQESLMDPVSEVPENAGAGGGTWTRDLLITNQLLCH